MKLLVATLILSSVVNSCFAACTASQAEINSSCFEIVSESTASWAEAKFLCRAQGGELAKISDCTTFGELVAFIHVNGHDQDELGYWIGASDDGLEGYWMWSDLTPVNLGTPYWGVDDEGNFHPSGGTARNCGQMHPFNAYYFSDANCETYNHYICEIPNTE